MATDYAPTKYPAQPWTAEQTQRFNAVLSSMPWESYPNGNSGWQDRQHQRFISAGFRLKWKAHGNAAVISAATFDVDWNQWKFVAIAENRPYYESDVWAGAFGLLVAGGAQHIGSCDSSGQRPVNYTRGELPHGVILEESAEWVGNDMHGWTGRRVVTRCYDGIWLSIPQPTSKGDWASRKIA
jgi:hypothetical protein